MKAIFALSCYLLVGYVQLFQISLKESYQNFIQTLATLPLVSMNFAIAYFMIFLVNQFKFRRVSVKFLDTLFLISFSLAVLSTSFHWYLNSIDPELVSSDLIEAGSKEYYCGMFLYFGNLVVLFWFGFNLSSFSKISFKVVGCFMGGFLFWYFGIFIGTKVVTGEFPYKFVGRFGLSDYLRMVVVLFTINVLSVAGFEKLVKGSIKLKKS
jgi:hypothetical protein